MWSGTQAGARDTIAAQDRHSLSGKVLFHSISLQFVRKTKGNRYLEKGTTYNFKVP